jgi:hypothetical protein
MAHTVCITNKKLHMPKDKKNRDEYPKMSGNDKRWKQQDEFDSAGAQRELEDEDKNASIPRTEDEKRLEDEV